MQRCVIVAVFAHDPTPRRVRSGRVTSTPLSDFFENEIFWAPSSESQELRTRLITAYWHSRRCIVRFVVWSVSRGVWRVFGGSVAGGKLQKRCGNGLEVLIARPGGDKGQEMSVSTVCFGSAANFCCRSRSTSRTSASPLCPLLSLSSFSCQAIASETFI